MTKGWIGVDFDGTLAYYGDFRDINYGKPIEPMLIRVKEWVRRGQRVKIMTARASDPNTLRESIKDIQDWCEKYGLPRLEVTCQKDYDMIELWDDRCVRVECNTGKILSSESIII